MKAVVDTNVLVSGVYWQGPPRKIMEAWEKRAFQLVVSPPILTEYERVLVELGSKFPAVQCSRVLELIAVHAEVVSPVRFARPVCKDKDDDKFLETALAAGAPYVVSGDKLLLAVDGYRGISVLPPAAFLKKVASA
jgi:putative PIN family toxin of toxin-antitoxin system